MSKFIQLHLLTSYPPSNPNRDDLGRPKTARMGGVDRLRISSQSLKRAWRTSDVCMDKLTGNTGIRTKHIGDEVYKRLVTGEINEKKAMKWAGVIASQFGKLKKDSVEIEQLVHVSKEELELVYALVDKLIVENRDPENNELKFLRNKVNSVDIALFGRMLASSPEKNIEAAAQVAHAISVNQIVIEDDYFTAVDDLNSKENAGASHISEAGFSSGVFYIYICINKTLLIENLNGNIDLANAAIQAYIEAALTVAPSGKQNSYANRVRASYSLVEIGNQQPRSLSVAFLDPVTEKNQLEASINRIATQKENMDRVYGPCSEADYSFNVCTGTGSMADLLAFSCK